MNANFRQSFRVAITTRYMGPTNFKGSRIVVTSGNGHRMIVSWDHALDVGENHAAAAKALADKMEWGGEWVGGGTKDGYVFVNLPRG